MSETPRNLLPEARQFLVNSGDPITRLMAAVFHILDHLEEQAGQTETKPSSPATESTADGPNGSAISSLTWHFVKADPSGGSRIIATVTSHDFSLPMTPGGVRSLSRDKNLILVTPDQWASLRQSGQTPSTIREAAAVGRPAGGEEQSRTECNCPACSRDRVKAPDEDAELMEWLDTLSTEERRAFEVGFDAGQREARQRGITP